MKTNPRSRLSDNETIDFPTNYLLCVNKQSELRSKVAKTIFLKTKTYKEMFIKQVKVLQNKSTLLI
jgi:hypothetical protein